MRSSRVVYLLGSDGAGKTTLGVALRNSIPKSQMIYLGLGEKGWKLNFARWFRQFIDNKAASVAFWSVVFPLEILIRRFSALNSRALTWLVDRVPGAPLLHNSVWRALYRSILPRPDLIVLLHGSPEVLSARKPFEVTPMRVEEDFRKWQAVSALFPGAQVVELDTTKISVEQARLQVLMAIESLPQFIAGQN